MHTGAIHTLSSLTASHVLSRYLVPLPPCVRLIAFYTAIFRRLHTTARHKGELGVGIVGVKPSSVTLSRPPQARITLCYEAIESSLGSLNEL